MKNEHVELLVIGAGPGGYVAAIRAAQLGQKVTIVDSSELGGVCLNRGCIPSKALISASKYFEQFSKSKENKMGIVAESVSIDFIQMQEWKQEIVKKLTGGVHGLLKGNGISIMKGQAVFLNSNTVRVKNDNEEYSLHFKKCIIATGSRPIELPKFPFGGRILSSTEVLQLTEIPKNLVVIGGGYIGIELSQAFSKLGTNITILEGKPHILPNFEESLSKIVEKNLKSKGVKLVSEAIADKAETSNEKVIVTYSLGNQQYAAEGDYLFVAVGRKPNTDNLNLEAARIQINQGLIEVNEKCQTSNSNIYAIGDITKGPQLAHKASYEGKVAAEAIAGLPSTVDYRAIPTVVFSDPEIATVGLSETEAKGLGMNVIVGKFSYGANGRALSLNDPNGFVKVIVDKDSSEILGAQIVGNEASNLIAEIALAIEMGSSLKDIALTIHAHPTLSEMIMEACEVAEGNSVHAI